MPSTYAWVILSLSAMCATSPDSVVVCSAVTASRSRRVSVSVLIVADQGQTLTGPVLSLHALQHLRVCDGDPPAPGSCKAGAHLREGLGVPDFAAVPLHEFLDLP